MKLTQENIWIPLGILAALSSAMSVICDKMGTHYIDGPIVGIFETGITLLMLMGVFLYSRKSFTRAAITWQVVPYILASAFFTGLSWVAYYVIMNYATVSQAASLDQFSLIFVFGLAMVFLQEKMSWSSLIGSLLLLGGMGLMIW